VVAAVIMSSRLLSPLTALHMNCMDRRWPESQVARLFMFTVQVQQWVQQTAGAIDVHEKWFSSRSQQQHTTSNNNKYCCSFGSWCVRGDITLFTSSLPYTHDDSRDERANRMQKVQQKERKSVRICFSHSVSF
jgi:hypothetical protein